jgi:hypothetical protein
MWRRLQWPSSWPLASAVAAAPSTWASSRAQGFSSGVYAIRTASCLG